MAGRQAPDVQVTTARVSIGPIVRRIIASGILQPVTTVEVAARTSRTIQSIEVDDHAIVHTGQVLVAGDTHLRQVWEYDGRQLTPIEVHAGLADDEWTEVVGGALQPGEALVTDASLRRGQRR
jgi:multidrug efflux pump subunit AcrA (membrane-fusion protein)